MRTLVDLFLATGEEKFLEPIPRFLLWLKRSQLEPNKWARLYELKTNKPIYGDRDGEIHYTVAELSAERQTGYAWQGGFGVPEAISYYERVRSDGREKSLAQELRADAPVPSAAEVSRIIAAQDSQGRWMTNDWILMRTVAENITRLASYLGASRPSERAP
jgi:hypothetical protein